MKFQPQNLYYDENTRLKAEYDRLRSVYRESQASRNRSIERELKEKLELRLEIERLQDEVRELRAELGRSEPESNRAYMGLELCPDCQNYFDSEADRTCPYC